MKNKTFSMPKELEEFEEVGMHPGPVYKFFYGLYLTKKPNPRPTNDIDMFPWALRHYAGVLYFNLGNEYQKFITWLTQFYPFSFLYPYSLMHAKNKLLRKFILRFENLAKKNSIALLICGSGYDGNVTTYEALMNQQGGGRGDKKLESLLQKELGSVYIRRDSPKKIRIIIPNETMEIQYSALRK